MNTSWKFLILAVGLFLAGCGDQSSQTSTLPAPASPNGPGAGLPTTPSTTPSGLPDLSRANPINLIDKINFSGLSDLLSASNQIVVSPMVLEPLIKMTLTNDRSTYVKGKLLIAFEDQLGFWGAELPTVDSASVRDAYNVDSIHTDNEFSVRVLTSVSGTNLYGIIYYRIRRSGETQCLKQTVRCVGPQGQTLPDSFCTYPTPDIATPCRSYMNPNDTTNVKTLGTFTAKTSDWFTN